MGTRRKNEETEERVAGALSLSRREGTGWDAPAPVLGLALERSRGSSLAAAAGPANGGWHGRSPLRRASAFPGRAEI